MLIRFRVQNHRSIRDEQTLSMVAADPEDDPRLLATPAIPEKLLPSVALYGANASGKSNVLHALAFACDAVDRSHRSWEPQGRIPREPFALSSAGDGPSTYDFDFIVDGQRYGYGFVLSATRVEEEWLFAWPKGTKEVWFERKGDIVSFFEELKGENETIRAIMRPNSLFLSAAAQNNHPVLSPLHGWFVGLETARVARVDNLRSENFVFGVVATALSDPRPPAQAFRKDLLAMLQNADIGIVDVRSEEHDEPSRGKRLRLRHEAAEGGEAWLPLEAESSGTLGMIRLAWPMISALWLGGLVAIDELEASLHPSIALELIRLFNDPKRNPRGAQLIFSTHDTNLLGRALDEPPLRRDQIWFTEKDREGATHLYPLTDFESRGEENLERGYLQGRYGAVPYLGNFAAAFGGKKDD